MKVNISTNPLITETLTQSDPKLKQIIDSCGFLDIRLKRDYFVALVRSIIGQQLSGKAAASIYQRLISSFNGCLSPDKLLGAEIQTFMSIGVSRTKTQFIKNLSEAIIDDNLCLEDLETLENKAVVRRLVEIKGIGQWTAEMFLIFSLGRQDVFPLGDGALRRAVASLYKRGNRVEESELIQISDKWRPFRTFASLYLWEAIDREIINTKTN